MGLSNRINNQTNRGKMKQLTNDIYRTKKKLELLESEGIGQLLMDFSRVQCEEYSETNVINDIAFLKQQYLKIIQDYKPSKQIKIEYNG